MAEYIEREKAISICQSHYEHCLKMHDFSGDSVAYDIRSNIQGLPAADVVEVKHGYWIRHIDDIFPADSTLECSVCHEEECIFLCGDNFCPNCGAKMDLKEGADNGNGCL